MKSRETAIIIANYNGYSDTVLCVKSLLGSSYRDFFVVIVDDFSNDKDKIINIKSEFQNCEIDLITILNDENKGFAGANNVGIKEALKYTPKFIMLLNNDTVVSKDAIKVLVSETSDDTVTGSKIMRMDNPDIIWSAGGVIDKELLIPKNAGEGEMESDLYNQKMECDFLSFCNVCIPVNAFDTVGFIDEDYYMYSEDVDYCYRLKRNGYKCVYIPEAVIFHRAGVAGANGSFNGTYYGIRNECYIRDKYIAKGKSFNKKLFTKVKKEHFLRNVLHKPNEENEVYYQAMKAYFEGEVGKDDASDVYICDSAYHVLVTLVKIFTSENNKLSELILCTNDVLPEKVISKIKEKKIFSKVKIYNDLEKIDPELDYSASFFLRGKSLKSQLDKAVNFDYSNKKEYFIYNDNSILGKCLNAHKIKYNLIEDGLNVYRLGTVITNNYKEPSYKKWLRKRFNAGFYCYGQSKYSKTIEVNSAENLVIKIPAKKLIIKPRQELFDKLSREQKEVIFSIFLDSNEYKALRDSIERIKGDKSFLLITQPLFDDKITSKEIHRKFYEDIVSKYANGRLVIKPHPRDKFDYRDVFPDAVIIQNNYLPIETLGFFENINFDKAITWCSTSVESIDFCKEKITLGIDYIKPYILMDKGFESMWSYAKMYKKAGL